MTRQKAADHPALAGGLDDLDVVLFFSSPTLRTSSARSINVVDTVVQFIDLFTDLVQSRRIIGLSGLGAFLNSAC